MAAKQTRLDRFRRYKSWFTQEMQRQSANRFQMALDEDYYDCIQWTPSEAAELIRRGQLPVAWNEIKPTIDWMLGTERRTRMDYKIIARNEKSDEADQDAKLKTNLLKYLDDVNRAGFERSQAFDDAIKGGLGWIEVGVRADPEDDPMYIRSESWRNMLYDSLGQHRDINQDSRYVFRFKSVDLDVAKAYFPGNDKALEAAAMMADQDRQFKWWNGRPIDEYGNNGPLLPNRWMFYDPEAWVVNPRQRVMLIECWSREPFSTTTGKGAGMTDRTYMRMRCSVMTENEIIYDEWSPYTHNKFPFIPVWCYRRKRDNAPYGPIRALRGQQDVLNKAMSKAIWTASANQIVAEKDAFDPKVMTDEEVRDEMSAPDGMAILATGGLKKFQKIESQPETQGHLLIGERAVNSMRDAAGVTGENRGLDTNAQSGKAILAKQDQGGLVTAEVFDNLLLARQMEGEIELSLAEQYYTAPMTFATPGDRNKHEYHTINAPDPTSEGGAINDITARTARFVIGEQAWRQSLMQATFESLMELLGKISAIAPEAVKAMLATTLELADIPNKRTMVKAVRDALGQADPDEKPTPEEEQRQMVAQSQKEQMAQAQVDLIVGKAREANAKGEKISADSLLAMMGAFYEALQAAQIVATVPGTAPVADVMLQGGGFKQQGGQDPQIPQPAAPMPAVVPPELQQADGALQGIETNRNDGLHTGVSP